MNFPLSEQLEVLLNFNNFLYVTTGKGYLTYLDLTQYPIVSDLLPLIIKDSLCEEGVGRAKRSRQSQTVKKVWRHINDCIT